MPRNNQTENNEEDITHIPNDWPIPSRNPDKEPAEIPQDEPRTPSIPGPIEAPIREPQRKPGIRVLNIQY